MKTANSEMELAAELLYGSKQETESKVANPSKTFNFFGPPSLIKGIEYPVSDEVEQLLKKAYTHGYKDSLQKHRAGRIVEDQPLLDFFRKRVEEIRKEKIKSGEIEPATVEERKWRLGL